MSSVADELGFDPEALHRKYLEERDRRLGGDSGRAYLDMAGDYAGFNVDPYAPPQSPRDPVSEEIDVIVLGGGLAGLMTSVNLLREGIENFKVIEQAGDFGGTWYWNRYPGIRCDIESYTYIPLLEEVDTVPSEKYAVGKEIFEHCQALGRKFGLYERTLFQTVVKTIRWDAESARWHIATDRGDDIRARHVIVSSGPLHKPKLPDVPGIRDFKGAAFHTSRWDYDYTGGDSSGNLTGLADKRVALIGVGATGIQVLPHLAEWSRHVHVIQRTPAAVDRRNNKPTDVAWFRSQPPGWQDRRIENFCLTIMGVPQDENLVNDCWTDVATLLVGFNNSDNAAIRDASPEQRQQLADFMKMEDLRRRIATIVKDPQTAESLKPWYNLFCKRPLFSDDYYPVFNRPNVTLVDTHGKGVDRITEDAVIVDGKRYEVDCIVFATGFRAGAYTHRSGGYELIGRDGVTLEDHWSHGVRSVHGTKTRFFPNFHIVGTLTHASQSFNYPQVTKAQTAHSVKMIARCLNEGLRSVEITAEAEQRWADQMKAKAQVNANFEIECTPGYYNNEGKKDDAPSLFGGMYGGGPIEYMAILSNWLDNEMERDLQIERETDHA